uniref:HMA domain-containing protein n=1 Tax=Kalanchoe fedtschenkoi TaxID=63787 RepID=A0A7N0UCA1_KALFE
MGEKKVTVMILKVDLQCDRCYKKVKKVLCKFPEIQDRVFDEKSNIVTITVICCDPERIRCRLCRKGRGSIKSIDIKDSPPPAAKPESPKKPPPAPAPEPVKKQPEPPSKAPEPVPQPPKPAPKSPEPAPKAPDPAPKQAEPEPEPERVKPLPLFGSDPIPTCCEQCYGGRAGGPCNYGYEPSPVHYDGYFNGRISFNGFGPNRGCHPGRCADYFCEENPAGCSVM